MTDTSAPAPGSDPTRSCPPSEGGWFWIDQRVLEDYDLTATELAVYAAICRVVTDGTGWASRRRLADLAGCRVRAVTAAVRTLEDEGLVDSYRRFGDRGQLPNGYRVADLRRTPLQDMQGGGADPDGLDAYDDVEGRFHWLAHVGDEDKRDAVHAVARLTIDELGAHPEDVPLEDVIAAALAAAYPDQDVSTVQRDHVQSHLQEINGESSWTWAVAAIAVAAVLGMEPARVSSVLDGWQTASSTSAAGDTSDWDERPQTLDEAKTWAKDLGLSERAGAGLWYVAGRRDWTCSGRVGKQGETIEDLEAWVRAHQNDLMAAAP